MASIWSATLPASTSSASGSAARLGVLFPAPASADRPARARPEPVATPHMLLFSRGAGCLPASVAHLREVRGLRALQLSCGDVLKKPGADALREAGVGVHQYMNWGGFVVYATAADRLANQFGPANAHGTKLRCASGHVFVTPRAFADLQAALRPDLVACLSDEIPACVTAKRAHKAVARSVAWLDEVLERLREHKEEVPCLAVVQGGAHADARVACARAMRERPVAGFVLGGFCSGESPAQRAALLAVTVAELPADRVRVLGGVGAPLDVLEGVAHGVDLFEAAYPQALASAGYAACFALDADGGGDGEERVVSKVNMRDARFREADEPLVAGCACYTCRRHTRAYVNHLLNVHELLGVTLLYVHNVHHYARFMAAIRAAIADGAFDQYRARFRARFL